MSKLNAYVIANCDDAVIFWSARKPIDDCFGFAIEREKKATGSTTVREVLPNRTGGRERAAFSACKSLSASLAWSYRRKT